MKKFFALLMAVMMVASLFAGCGAKEAASSEGAALKIGMTGPLTGGASEYGLAVRGGMEIAVA